jgi:hypothetical protein
MNIVFILSFNDSSNHKIALSFFYYFRRKSRYCIESEKLMGSIKFLEIDILVHIHQNGVMFLSEDLFDDAKNVVRWFGVKRTAIASLSRFSGFSLFLRLFLMVVLCSNVPERSVDARRQIVTKITQSFGDILRK